MAHYYAQSIPPKRSKKMLFLALSGLFVFGILLYVGYVLVFANVQFTPPFTSGTVSYDAYTPNYPVYGSSGVAIAGSDISLTNNDQQHPVASTAKIVAALTVLDTIKDKDIKNEFFTISESDVTLTNAYAAKDGSIAAAPLGARVSYYTALQYMLIISANNYTDMLVQRVFGTQAAYNVAATSYLQKNGLNNTVITDATGFSPTTISTAQDMLRIASLAVANPTITEITKQRSVVQLNGVTTKSTNLFLPTPTGEVIGLKTGYTDEARAVFLNATQLPNGAKIVSIAMGADTPLASQTDSGALVTSMANTQKEEVLFAANQPITIITLPWGNTATVSAKETIAIPNAANEDITYTITFNNIDTQTTNGDAVGTITARSALTEKSLPVYIEDYEPAPLFWRMLHPL